MKGKNVHPDDLFGPVRKELQGHRVMTHAALHGCFSCLLCFLWPIFRCSFFTLRLTCSGTCSARFPGRIRAACQVTANNKRRSDIKRCCSRSFVSRPANESPAAGRFLRMTVLSHVGRQECLPHPHTKNPVACSARDEEITSNKFDVQPPGPM